MVVPLAPYTQRFLISPAACILPAYIPLRKTPAAFTHTSFLGAAHWGFEIPAGEAGGEDYERLEHVGDAMLGFIVTELISDLYPGLTVGSATLLKSRLVNNKSSLCHLSNYYKLPSFLVAAQAPLSILRRTPSIQADLFEAYLAALSSEQGFLVAREWARAVFEPLARLWYVIMRRDFEDSGGDGERLSSDGMGLVTLRERGGREGIPIKAGINSRAVMEEVIEEIEVLESLIPSAKRVRLNPASLVDPDNSLTQSNYVVRNEVSLLETWRLKDPDKKRQIEFVQGEVSGPPHRPDFSCMCTIWTGVSLSSDEQEMKRITDGSIGEGAVTSTNGIELRGRHTFVGKGNSKKAAKKVAAVAATEFLGL